MKKTYLYIAIAALILIVLFALIQKPTSSIPNENAKSVRIGVAVALTGYAAEWGEGEKSAVEMVVEEFNQKNKDVQIELFVQDTKAEGLGTTNAIKHLIEVDKVEAIVGPTWGDSFQGAFPLATQAKVWTISPSAAMETIGEAKKNYPYVLTTWWPQKGEMRAIAEYLQKNSKTKIAVLTDKDGFNVQFGKDFATFATSNGLNIASQESVPISTTDFRTTILKLKNVKPDAVLVLLQDTSQVGPLNKQIRELGLTSGTGSSVLLVSTASTENQANLDTFPGMFEGVVYSFPKVEDDSLYQSYLAKHAERTGNKPTGPSFVPALNAAQALVVAIESREKSNPAGAGMLQFADVRAPGVGIPEVSFDAGGQIEERLFQMKMIQNDMLVEAR